MPDDRSTAKARLTRVLSSDRASVLTAFLPATQPEHGRAEDLGAVPEAAPALRALVDVMQAECQEAGCRLAPIGADALATVAVEGAWAGSAGRYDGVWRPLCGSACVGCPMPTSADAPPSPPSTELIDVHGDVQLARLDSAMRKLAATGQDTQRRKQLRSALASKARELLAHGLDRAELGDDWQSALSDYASLSKLLRHE